MSLEQAPLLTNHDAIRAWASAHGGRPVTSGARLELAFDPASTQGGEPSWDEWLRRFEGDGLALRCDPATGSLEYELTSRAPVAAEPAPPVPVIARPTHRRVVRRPRRTTTAKPRRKTIITTTVRSTPRRAPAKTGTASKPTGRTTTQRTPAKAGSRTKRTTTSARATTTTVVRRGTAATASKAPLPSRRAPATVRAPGARTVSADLPARKTTRAPARTTTATKRKTPTKTAPRTTPRGRTSSRKPPSRGTRG
jgi:hypothetical protein